MTCDRDRYSHFFKNSPYRPFLREERHSHGRYKTTGILACQDGHSLVDSPTADVVVGLTLNSRTAARWKVNGKWREIQVREAGHIKQQTGQTPYQFVQKIRLEMAIAYLLSAKMSLIDIALQLGFADQSHFTRFFRIRVGTTPKEYIKR